MHTISQKKKPDLNRILDQMSHKPDSQDQPHFQNSIKLSIQTEYH